MLYPSDAEAEQIFQRKIELLRSQTATTAAGNALATVLVSALMWSSLPHAGLALWSATVIIIVSLRLRVVYRHNNKSASELASCFRYCARSVAVNGVAWGVMFAYLAYHIEPRNMVYPFMVLGAITAGTSLTYNVYFNPFRYFALPALLMPCTVLLVSGSSDKLWVGMALLCWFILMHAIATQLSRFLAKSARYETENIALIRDLEYQKERGERLNEELQLKSQIIERLSADRHSKVSTIKPDQTDKRA